MTTENELGVIAESYNKLQGLHLLKKARENSPLSKASTESLFQAVFQAVEIAFINLDNLITSAGNDVNSGNIGSAVVKMSWAKGFHRILNRLSTVPCQFGFAGDIHESREVLYIHESPALKTYTVALKKFDQDVLKYIKNGEKNIESILGNQSINNDEFNFLHLARICSHETTIWENNLAEIHIPTSVNSYEEFISATFIREAVYDIVLKGDTYFTQFRALHQIPEILCYEANNFLEEVILNIRSNHLQLAVEQMNCVNILLDCILAAMIPIVDNLSTYDYHQIRENLGLTSGSHSISLHYHLFNDLYTQLCEELTSHILCCSAIKYEEIQLEEAMRQVKLSRFTDMQNGLLYLLFNECLKLRMFITQWRDLHLHLPRNELGGEFTKSLTGSFDAVKKVKQMKDIALKIDPLKILTKSKELPIQKKEQKHILNKYLQSESSLDSYLLKATGTLTKKRFQNVQEQSGFFANRCPFSPPSRRQV